MKDMRRLRFIVPLALCLLGAGCGDRQAAPFRRSVMLTEPVQAGGGVLRTFPGTVREAHAVSLGFKTPGQIERVMVQEGDRVRQGQLIATLDDADYRLGVEALEIQYGQLEQEVARMTKLYEGKSLSPNDYEKAVAGLRQVGVQLQANRNKLDYTRLYAPMDGYVQRVNFSQAEMVDVGTPVVDLLDVRRMEVTVSLPAEVYRQRGQIGDILCRFPAKGDEAIPMQLLGIAPKADGNQLYRMRLAFRNSLPHQLEAGTNVEVELSLAGDSLAGRFTLPQHSVFQSEGQAYVWVLAADSTVHKTAVALQGLDGEGRAVIASGLQGGEQVVRAGVHALQEGEKVNILAPASETNVGGLL